MKTIKQNLKTQAATIREMKQETSSGMRSGKYMGGLQWTLQCAQETYRYDHIAYCMIRGREYLEIENKTRPGNEINQSKLDRIITDMKADILMREIAEEKQNA